MILSAIAFTFHLQNKIDKAISFYHKVLSLQPHDTFANEMLHRALQTATNQIDIFEWYLVLCFNIYLN